MNASQYAGTVIVPTLSRIVLCAAFFTAGWAKVFTNAPYTPKEVETLKAIGVDVRQTVAVHSDRAAVMPAALRHAPLVQDEPAEPAQDEPTQDEPTQSEPAQDQPVDAPTTAEDTPEDAAPDGDEAVPPAEPATTDAAYEARALYKVGITLHNAGWQYAYQLAWGTAILELVGGALLLVGLFSRIWGLGLAITMALAFHIMSMNMFLEAPFEIARKLDGGAAFHQIYSQLGLFVLAFGIFITGPGPLSLDRAIFRRSAPDDIDIEVHQRP